MPDDVFEKYELIRRLGSGGMGEILLARQRGAAGSDRNVIIKMILPHLAQDPEFIGRFTDETRIAALLSHGNIVTIFESGCWQGRFFMVMEYVDGPDLKELLSMAGPLRQSDGWIPFCVHVLSETARALAYAHRKRDQEGRQLGIVHRDVSPSNILISSEGLVKLTDFGVAKAARRTSVTLPGKLHGKVNYMAPEQVRGMECDHRSDIFSLGVTGYEMLAGIRPFEGDSDIAVLEQIRSMKHVPLLQAAPSVPDALARIIARAMDADPAARWQSADEFLAALAAFAHESGMSMMSRDIAAMLAPLLMTTGDEAPANVSIDDFLVDALNDLPGTPSGGIRISTGEVVGRSRERTVTVSREVTGPAAAPATTEDGTVADTDFRTGTQAGTRMPHGRGKWIAAGIAVIALAAGIATWVSVDPTDAGDARNSLITDPGEPRQQSQANSGTPADPAGTPESAKMNAGSARPQKEPNDISSGSDPVQPPVTNEPVTTPTRIAATDTTDPTASDGTRIRPTGRGPDGSGGSGGASGSDEPDQAETQGPRKAKPAGQNRQDTFGAIPAADTGRAVFRFFPADAVVEIDGRAIVTDGNLVQIDLPAGSHTIAVSGTDGTHKKTRSFNIVAGRTLALGTIELDPGAASDQ